MLLPLLFFPRRIVRGASWSRSSGRLGVAGPRAANERYPANASESRRILPIVALCRGCRGLPPVGVFHTEVAECGNNGTVAVQAAVLQSLPTSLAASSGGLRPVPVGMQGRSSGARTSSAATTSGSSGWLPGRDGSAATAQEQWNRQRLYNSLPPHPAAGSGPEPKPPVSASAPPGTAVPLFSRGHPGRRRPTSQPHPDAPARSSVLARLSGVPAAGPRSVPRLAAATACPASPPPAPVPPLPPPRICATVVVCRILFANTGPRGGLAP